MNIAFPHDAIYYPFTLLRTGPSFGGAVGFYVPYVLSDGLGTVSGFCSPHTVHGPGFCSPRGSIWSFLHTVT
jgi:hypothetical protein